MLMVSCSENPHQLILNIYDNEIEGAIKDTVLYAIRDTTYFVKSKLNTTISSSRLLLGSSNGLEARPIMRFLDFTAIPDSAVIDSAKIRLKSDGNISDQNYSPFTVTLYPIINSWESNLDSVWNDYESNIDQDVPLSQLDITPQDSTDLVFTLNSAGVALVSQWLTLVDPVDENHGIILNFISANFIQNIFAVGTIQDPELIINYTVPGDSINYIDTLYATNDAFIYNGDVPRREDRNYTSTLIVYNTVFEFNLREFQAHQPDDISLLSATIELPVDRENSIIDSRYDASNVVSLRLLSQFENSTIEVDSTSGLWTPLSQWSSDSSHLETNTGTSKEKLAKSIIRRILVEPETPQSLVISSIDLLNSYSKPLDATSHYSYLAFFKVKNEFPPAGPRLIIEYWVPPAPRL